ncbi:RidA family protein [Paenibacillus spongiae]|uniref:Rid family detoxifying hydrolase n=1 Tax=Paenibacillus spongiae TaxID=2909671 RepID=A0ABY5S5K5_9BACL|nr:Rid family detoxifying hydrolase [Paenibacillus spongiae]UVI29201.1 Rid family detoxifying hydrolase [Paenibacillus spongiae]
MKQIILTDKAQQPGSMPYSQAIKVGNTVYVAGQGPFEPQSGMCEDSTMEYQARRTLENLKAILAEAGAQMSDVVKVTVFLGNGADFDEFNGYYKEYFSAPYPARAITGVSSNMLVQIDAIAVIE